MAVDTGAAEMRKAGVMVAVAIAVYCFATGDVLVGVWLLAGSWLLAMEAKCE